MFYYINTYSNGTLSFDVKLNGILRLAVLIAVSVFLNKIWQENIHGLTFISDIIYYDSKKTLIMIQILFERYDKAKEYFFFSNSGFEYRLNQEIILKFHVTFYKQQDSCNVENIHNIVILVSTEHLWGRSFVDKVRKQ